MTTMIDSPLLLCGVLFMTVAAAYAAAATWKWAASVGASLLIIAATALASNLGFIPDQSPVYSAFSGPVTSLAIVWLLFGVRLSDLRVAGARMIGAFALAIAATAVGAILASLLFSSAFPEDGWKLGGVLTGTYSGGSLNFVGVGRALDLPEDLFAAASAADNVVTSLWMGATLMLPLWLAGWYPKPKRAAQKATTAAGIEDGVELRPIDLALLGALGLVLVAGIEVLSPLLPGPSIVWLTTAALLCAQLEAVQNLRGSLLLGGLALNLFFCAIGAASRLDRILDVGLDVLWITLTVVAVHGLLLYAGGRLLRLDLPTLSVASQAAIGGPSTAIALANARGWTSLTLPGAAVGLLGYAVGTYSGLAVAELLKSLL